MKLDLKGIIILAFLAGIAAFFLFMPTGGIKAAPSITVQTLDGQTISPAQLQGKPYLVTFWATDCPSCVGEIPHLVELNRNLQGTGFRTLAIAMPHDEPTAIQAMRAAKGINYDIAHDRDGAWGQAFGGIKVTPTSFLVSPDGKIVRQQLGSFEFKQLEQQIRSLLQQAPKQG